MSCGESPVFQDLGQPFIFRGLDEVHAQNKNILVFPDENKTLSSKNFLLMPFLTKEAIW